MKKRVYGAAVDPSNLTDTILIIAIVSMGQNDVAEAIGRLELGLDMYNRVRSDDSSLQVHFERLLTKLYETVAQA